MLKKDKKLKYGSTIYYEDELNDDFEKTNLKRIDIPEDFVYTPKSKWYKCFSNFIYFGIAVPILSLVTWCYGIKVKGKENLKKLNGENCFIYSNHTSFLDVFDIQVRVFPFKRTDILGYTDSLSNKFLGWITKILGYMPIPDSPRTFRKFQQALETRVSKMNRNVIIYPEAHIWPYYNDIRPFISTSFKYPAKLNRPIVPITACYRKSKISKHAKITLYISEPIYPQEYLSVNENKEYLRDECYKEMKRVSEKYSTYKFVNYVKKEGVNDEAKE